MGKKKRNFKLYDEHKEAALKEQMRMRIIESDRVFKEKWKKYVFENCSPKQAKFAQFFMPPQWYKNLVRKIFWWFQIIYSFIFLSWMIWLHDFFFTFGVSKKITVPREGYRKLVIKVKGKVVEEMEMKV